MSGPQPQPPMEPTQAGPAAAAAAVAAQAGLYQQQMQRHHARNGFSTLPQPAPAPWMMMPGDTTKKPSKVSFERHQDICALCCDEKLLMFYFDCKHYPFCDQCLREMSKTTQGRVLCPVCKVQVKDARQIYYLRKK
ncbi:E3 ubiquitin-protein ligase APD1 [Frankliniella fusca]|uniref:E3 ubiquitin-protein ligase APD1 n=1 Tax=Frankliniella fusca TaxID=407009 RepID=A0AAE1HCP2_9NEOP|nr:E3 ubiquitin-protein ligase APD1 [Frankliniella fusca]